MKGNEKTGLFSQSLEGKNIPILTLDNKWYLLLDELGKENVKEIENNLNELLKRQGKLNTEARDIKRLKKKLVSEIMPMVDESNETKNSDINNEIENHKRLIEECNEKLEAYSDEMLDLPRDIDHINKKLMLNTMSLCYDILQDNTEEINEIENWVNEVRVELKKKLIKKQEMEQRNHDIYSYMHDIFGADVMNMFDLKYDPETKHPKN